MALAGNVVEPAMVGATQPTILDAPIAKVGAPMGAVQIEQAYPPLLVPECTCRRRCC